jgi:hypothetical protein
MILNEIVESEAVAQDMLTIGFRIAAALEDTEVRAKGANPKKIAAHYRANYLAALNHANSKSTQLHTSSHFHRAETLSNVTKLKLQFTRTENLVEKMCRRSIHPVISGARD